MCRFGDDLSHGNGNGCGWVGGGGGRSTTTTLFLFGKRGTGPNENFQFDPLKVNGGNLSGQEYLSLQNPGDGHGQAIGINFFGFDGVVGCRGGFRLGQCINVNVECGVSGWWVGLDGSENDLGGQ